MDNKKELYGYYEIENDKVNLSSPEKSSFIKKHAVTIIISVLLIILIILVIIPKVAVTINAGEKGVLFKRLSITKQGVQLDKVYDDGLYFVLPWNIMTPYNIRLQQKEVTMNILALQGMKIKLVTSIRYRPKMKTLPYLHQLLGPDYANTVVVPQVNGAVLAIFGEKHLENIYTNIYELIETVNIMVKKDLEKKGIIIDELIVKSIEFPKLVRSSINNKIKYKQIALTYEHKLDIEEKEAKRKKIEAKGIHAFQSIISNGISENYLKWKGIDATLKLAESHNSKVVVIGSAKNGLPLILNTDSKGKNVFSDKNHTKTNSSFYKGER